MRKFLLTSVGVTALAVSANATDFTLSGSSLLNIDDDGDTSVANTINVGVSKTFDNGMVLALSQNMNAASTEMTITSDAVSITFGDFDQNEKNTGIGGNAASADIDGDGASAASNNTGAISLGTSIAGLSVGASMNEAGDTMFGASMDTEVGGMAITVGGDVYSGDISSTDQTIMSVKATIGNIVAVANSRGDDSSATADIMTYSAVYTAGSLVLGFQGSDANTSVVSATYTIVPGMQFEMGSEDSGTATTTSAQLQMTF